jgi:hypothetical protein
MSALYPVAVAVDEGNGVFSKERLRFLPKIPTEAPFAMPVETLPWSWKKKQLAENAFP